MHEWALAEAIIAAVSQTVEKEGIKTVTEVTVKIGEMQQVEIDILEFALSQLKTAKLEKAKFNIEVVRAKLKCRVCEHQWFFNREKLSEDVAEAIHVVPEIAHAYVKCPKCGSPDFEIVEGRGVWLESIKGEK
ncbi:MAG: hydrogenase nickel incorporation protein HypA [Candidatus Bathyarchaeia archaeon]